MKLLTTIDIQNITGLSPASRNILCQQHAEGWDKRSAAFARAGQHREADDAQSEAVSLWNMADQIFA